MANTTRLKWFYNSSSGTINQEDTANPFFQVSLHSGTGWHGPFDTQQDALNYYETNKAKNPGWHAPSSSVLSKIGNVTGVSDAISNTFGLSDNQIQSWLIRIGEILLGIVLVGVGLAKVTGTTNSVARIVKAKI